MTYYYDLERRPDELYHHGIKGQKWGIRRFQNKDGSLTAAGKTRYTAKDVADDLKASMNDHSSALAKVYAGAHGIPEKAEQLGKEYEKEFEKAANDPEFKNRIMDQMHDEYVDTSNPEWFKDSVDDYVQDALNERVDAAMKSKRAEFDKEQDEYWDAVHEITDGVRDKYKDVTINSMLGSKTPGWAVVGEEIEKKLGTSFNAHIYRHFDDYWVGDTDAYYNAKDKLVNSITLDEYKKRFENVEHSDELYHYGIKGQKWGVRRFQPYSTTGARKGGKTGKEIGLAKRAGDSIKKFKQERAAKKAETAKAKAAKAAEDKKKRDEKLMADKERILREGSAGEVLTLKGKITNQELRTAVERINLEQQLAGIQAKQISEGKKLIQNVAGFVKTGADIADSVSRIKAVADKFADNDKEKARQKLIDAGTAEDVKKQGTKYLKADDYKKIANRMKSQAEIAKYLKGTVDDVAEDSEKTASMKMIKQMIDDALDEREDD